MCSRQGEDAKMPNDAGKRWCGAVRCIGMDGLSGGGKSTAAHALVSVLRSPFLPITLDDFFHSMEVLRAPLEGRRDADHTLSLEDVRALNWEAFLTVLSTARQVCETFVEEFGVHPLTLPCDDSATCALERWRSFIQQRAPTLSRYVLPSSELSSMARNPTAVSESEQHPPIPGEWGGEGLAASKDVNALRDEEDNGSFGDHVAYDEECRREVAERHSSALPTDLHGFSLDLPVGARGGGVDGAAAPVEGLVLLFIVCEGFTLFSHPAMREYFDCTVHVEVSEETACLRRFLRAPRGNARRRQRGLEEQGEKERRDTLEELTRGTESPQWKSTAGREPCGVFAATVAVPPVLSVVSQDRVSNLCQRILESCQGRQPRHLSSLRRWWSHAMRSPAWTPFSSTVFPAAALSSEEAKPKGSNTGVEAEESAARRHQQRWLSDDYYYFPFRHTELFPFSADAAPSSPLPEQPQSQTPQQWRYSLRGAAMAHPEDDTELLCAVEENNSSTLKGKEETGAQKGDGGAVCFSPEMVQASFCRFSFFEVVFGIDRWQHLYDEVTVLLKGFQKRWAAVHIPTSGLSSSCDSPPHAARGVEALLITLRSPLRSLSTAPALLWGGLHPKEMPSILHLLTSRVVELYLEQHQPQGTRAGDEKNETYTPRCSCSVCLQEVDGPEQSCWDMPLLLISVRYALRGYALFRFWYVVEVLYYAHLQTPIWMLDRPSTSVGQVDVDPSRAAATNGIDASLPPPPLSSHGKRHYVWPNDFSRMHQGSQQELHGNDSMKGPSQLALRALHREAERLAQSIVEDARRSVPGC